MKIESECGENFDINEKFVMKLLLLYQSAAYVSYECLIWAFGWITYKMFDLKPKGVGEAM